MSGFVLIFIYSYVIIMFFFFVRRAVKYEYKFEEIERLIGKIEEEFDELNQLEIESFVVNEKKTLEKRLFRDITISLF